MTASRTLDQAQSREGEVAATVAGFLGLFIVTFDAVVVNIALPTINRDLGGGIAGLQWVVDGYTLMFAAFLLSAGSLSDRLGGRSAFASGIAVFGAASLACGLAPTLAFLVVARFIQGTAAAVMMPSSLAMLRHAHADSARRSRAVGFWAAGGGLASTSGPVLGGVLTLVSWRWIFLLNLPVCLLTLLATRRVTRTPQRRTTFDWTGQLAAILAMGGLTDGTIQAGEVGFAHDRVIAAFAVAVVAALVFVASQRLGAHPMVPPRLFGQPVVQTATLVGFAFMVGFWGLPFVYGLYFQQQRGQSALGAGLLFLPMMLVGAVLTPFSAWFVERAGHRRMIVIGLSVMGAGLAVLALLPQSTPLWALAVLMMLVGLGGPFVMPPVTSALLNDVRGDEAGTASGILHVGRQVGGALAVAVFGALLAKDTSFYAGVRASLLLAAAAAMVTVVVVAVRLRNLPPR